MYKIITEPLPRSAKTAETAPAEAKVKSVIAGDIVSISLCSQTEFYIQVDDVKDHLVMGQLIAIGPVPVQRHSSWQLGDKVQFDESAATVVVKRG